MFKGLLKGYPASDDQGNDVPLNQAKSPAATHQITRKTSGEPYGNQSLSAEAQHHTTVQSQKQHSRYSASSSCCQQTINLQHTCE